MIRVGFIIIYDNGSWLGGYNYYRSLINNLKKYSENIIPVIFTNPGSREILKADFPDVEIYEKTMLKRKHIKWFSWKVIKKLLGRDKLLEDTLKKANVNILSHYGHLGNSKFPVITWIPDFQHVYLPELFNEKEILRRNNEIVEFAKNSNIVILSSESAREDFKKFIPDLNYKARVLRFVSNIEPSDFKLSKDEVASKYNLPKKFFFLPNQFWKHKNHLVVFKAMKLLQQKGIQLILTGNFKDYRQPDYIKELTEYIDNNDLRMNIRMLGVVPYKDLIALMNHSIAVINPSLFEGWSTTVEESKSLGKRIILSDIPVHKEQNPKGGLYFNPNSPEELAENMNDVWNGNYIVEDKVLKVEALNTIEEYRINFVKNYEQIVLEIHQ